MTAVPDGPSGGPKLPSGVGFALTVPPSWLEFEVRPGRREVALERLIAGRVRDVPELRQHRTALTRLVREQARQAWDAGAAYLSCMVEPTEDGPVTASAVVLILPGPMGVADDDPDRLGAVARPFTTKEPAGDGDVWQRVDTVAVPGAGPAVRVAGVQDVSLPGQDGAVRVVQLQTLVPLPQGRVLVLTCSSPVLALQDVLLELFDAVSGTLEVHRPGPIGAQWAAPAVAR